MLALNGLVARLGNSIWRAGHVSTHPLTNKRGTREGAAPGASAAWRLRRHRARSFTPSQQANIYKAASPRHENARILKCRTELRTPNDLEPNSRLHDAEQSLGAHHLAAAEHRVNQAARTFVPEHHRSQLVRGVAVAGRGIATSSTASPCSRQTGLQSPAVGASARPGLARRECSARHLRGHSGGSQHGADDLNHKVEEAATGISTRATAPYAGCHE